MKETTYSPAPWAAEPLPDAGVALIWAGGHHYAIGEIYCNTDPAMGDANIALICAAVPLLDALRAAVALLQACDVPSTSTTVDQCLAAIRQAEGEDETP